jgi:hypothetical protein
MSGERVLNAGNNPAIVQRVAGTFRAVTCSRMVHLGNSKTNFVAILGAGKR